MTGPHAAGEPRWSLPLIHTKMAPPRAPNGHVRRPGLVARIARSAGGSVCSVTAPAGFGKTTLLAECYEVLRGQGHIVAWLSLDHDDEDLQLFGAYLVAAFARQNAAVASGAEALLRDDPATPVKTVVSVLLNAIAACGQEVYLVLDDFDRVTSRAIRALVSRMLRYASGNLHVLLGGRSEDAVQLGPMQASGRLLRLGDADLRFSMQDAQTFFEQANGVALDAECVAVLNRATEGWVAGLQLAALGLHDANDASRLAQHLATSRCGIDNYLHDTVLSHLPPSMQQFLVRTSILDRLSGGACNAIMGAGARSWQKLDWLERHNVFIRALDDERRWFRSHALLQDALRRKAERLLADELPALHRRASQWFAAEQLWTEAVRHALAAGDMEKAAAWVEDVAMALVDRSDVGTILGWLARLPDGLVQTRLRLRLAEAWALGLSMQSTEAQAAIRTLKADMADGRFDAELDRNAAVLRTEMDALSAVIAGFADESAQALALGEQAMRTPAWRSAPPRARHFARTALVFGMGYAGRFDDVRQIHAEAIAHRDPTRRPLYGDVYQACMFGLAAMVQGEWREAIGVFESALANAEKTVGPHSTAAALPAGYLSELYYEQNRLERARAMVVNRSATVLEACALGSVLRHSVTAAKLAMRNGDLPSALVLLADARELAVTRGWDRLRAGCDACAILLHLQADQLAPAQKKLAELRDILPHQPGSVRGSFLETLTSCVTSEARVHMAMRQPAQAVSALLPLRTRLAAAGMRHATCQTDLLQALAHAQQGEHEAAMAALAQALQFAQCARVMGCFLDEGEPMRRLLIELRRQQQPGQAAHAGWRPGSPRLGPLDGAFLDQLLEAFDTLVQAPARLLVTPVSAMDCLSTRETEILQLVAGGLSNKEVARALTVAPETVKWHLKNVFDKLNVGSRIEAVRAVFGAPDDPRFPA